ncbi:MAG: elongation factor P [Deltaproteobacteria bacterium]|nr:elongation factor P [Deltaproteobacteria bacterium]MCD6137422.1 elongation factor P [Deltaproteobacteria bacterium]RLB93024.1 MAG: elongation factor P [Deltaproteobacteria bacterium]RLC10326.1 MAG: elongation factor P [Deltaproteobacteria bacterium]
MYSTSDFKKGLKIEVDGKPFEIVDFLHVKPGKGGAFVRTKLKNMLTGRVLDQTFRSGEKVGRPDIQEKQMQYLYRDGDNYCFMDNETYDQIFLRKEHIGESRLFLPENTTVNVLFFNSEPIGIELPIFVELTITDTEPGVKGDTASKATKPATLETGAVVSVPIFLNVGDRVKVDTRSGTYVERAK